MSAAAGSVTRGELIARILQDYPCTPRQALQLLQRPLRAFAPPRPRENQKRVASNGRQ
jgi:hypothetical protein